jgi:hypothetical protein
MRGEEFRVVHGVKQLAEWLTVALQGSVRVNQCHNRLPKIRTKLIQESAKERHVEVVTHIQKRSGEGRTVSDRVTRFD